MKAILIKYRVYIILFGIILILSGINYSLKKSNDRKDAKIVRLTGNLDEVLQENNSYLVLNLTQKEAIKATSLKLDSLAHLLDIRPKNIERIVTKTIIQHDTIEKLITVVQKSDSTWSFFDKGDCYEYRGEATLANRDLSIKKTEFLYLNKMTDVFYWYRNWFLGKKKYTQESRATCGQASTKDITIVKK
jgi:plasmid maintenance system antidote protein VapI